MKRGSDDMKQTFTYNQSVEQKGGGGGATGMDFLLGSSILETSAIKHNTERFGCHGGKVVEVFVHEGRG